MNLCQDIVVTLNLSEMTPEKYQENIKQLKMLSANELEITTYDPEKYNDELSKEQLELLDSLQ